MTTDHGKAAPGDRPEGGRCQEKLLELSAYLEGDLTPERMAALETHLTGCECCGRMADSLRQAIALCRSEEARTLPVDVEVRARERVRQLLREGLGGR